MFIDLTRNRFEINLRDFGKKIPVILGCVKLFFSLTMICI